MPAKNREDAHAKNEGMLCRISLFLSLFPALLFSHDPLAALSRPICLTYTKHTNRKTYLANTHTFSPCLYLTVSLTHTRTQTRSDAHILAPDAGESLGREALKEEREERAREQWNKHTTP